MKITRGGRTVTIVSPSPRLKEMNRIPSAFKAVVSMAEPEAMWMDKEWQSWADARMARKDPQVKNVGIAYMLKGDQGASNTDPFATKPAPDNHWV